MVTVFLMTVLLHASLCKCNVHVSQVRVPPVSKLTILSSNIMGVQRSGVQWKKGPVGRRWLCGAGGGWTEAWLHFASECPGPALQGLPGSFTSGISVLIMLHLSPSSTCRKALHKRMV